MRPVLKAGFLCLLLHAGCSRTVQPTNEHEPLILEDSFVMTDSLVQAFPELEDPLFVFWSNSPDSTPADKMPPNEVAQLQEGDIILRKGYGSVSDFIAVYLNEDYPVTHCAFYVKEGYAQPSVLHTVSNDKYDGMFTEPLADYVGQSKVGSVVVVRLKGDPEKRRQVLREAKILLDKGIEFDMGFNDNDSTKMYCAEMMRHVFKKVYKDDLLDKRAQKYGLDVIHMNNFFDPDHFEVVINHFDTLTAQQKLE